MKFNRTISVNGTKVIETIDVNMNFSYTSGIVPTFLNFSFTKEGTNVSGEATLEGIRNYSVGQGIVTDEFMKLVETECKTVLTNYETV